MNDATVITGTEQGFAWIGLRSPTAELRMVPELGGRIVSLRSRRTGREWCWHQPREDWLWANRPGDPFSASPQAGFDECVPTVAPCRVKERNLPDHGEVWSRAWNLDVASLTKGVLRTSVALTVSPFRLTRTLRVDPRGAFVFEYTLQNTGTEEEPYLWSFHPLLTFEPGDHLELPPEVRSLRLNGGIGTAIAFGDVWPYPEPFEGVRLDYGEVPGMPGGCVKGFAHPLRSGYAALTNERTGDRLEFRWDPAVLPILGVWINRGHGGFHHVALEPSSGAPDSLSDALSSWGLYRSLQPGRTDAWSMTLNVF